MIKLQTARWYTKYLLGELVIFGFEEEQARIWERKLLAWISPHLAEIKAQNDPREAERLKEVFLSRILMRKKELDESILDYYSKNEIL